MEGSVWGSTSYTRACRWMHIYVDIFMQPAYVHIPVCMCLICVLCYVYMYTFVCGICYMYERIQFVRLYL